MNERETHDVLMYLCAALNQPVPPPLRKVWLDVFAHESYADCQAAAKLMVGRRMYGIPQPSDLKAALAELRGGGKLAETWGQAWDTWVRLARKHGYYARELAERDYARLCPLGWRALGTSAAEWWELRSDDIPTFRAQFRQRYEALSEQAHAAREFPPDVARRVLAANPNLPRNVARLLASSIKVANGNPGMTRLGAGGGGDED